MSKNTGYIVPWNVGLGVVGLVMLEGREVHLQHFRVCPTQPVLTPEHNFEVVRDGGH